MRALGVAAFLVATPAPAQRAWTTPGEQEAADARALAASGACEQALDPFDRSVELRPGDPAVRRDRGRCHDQIGNRGPAIEDYRAYLSLAPGSSDANVVQARLDALEAAAAAEAQEKATVSVPAAAPGNPDASEPHDEGADTDGGSPDGDWFLGLHVGAREWSADGFAEPSSYYGLEGGGVLLPWLDVRGRAFLVHTDLRSNDGFGLTAGAVVAVPIDANAVLLGVFGADAGYESQSDVYRAKRTFVFLRAAPALRWRIVSAVRLDLGPDLVFGSMTSGSPIAGEVGEGSATVSGLGGYASLLWVLGASSEP